MERSTLRLENNGAEAIERFRLALDEHGQTRPGPGRAVVRLARQVSGYHELAPSPVFVLGARRGAGDHRRWSVDHTPHHANDGPASAFVVLDDGSTIDVDVEPMTGPEPSHRFDAANNARRCAEPTAPGPRAVAGDDRSRSCGRVGPASGGRVRSVARLRSGSNEVGDVWRAVARAERRLHPGRAVGARRRRRQRRRRVAGVGRRRLRWHPGTTRSTIDDARAEVVVAASDAAGFRHGFVTLAQLLRDGAPSRCGSSTARRTSGAGLHVDLARQFFPASDVERLIDLAAWRKLDRLHLHLTDDEAWRVPIDGYPELTDRRRLARPRAADPAVARFAGGGDRWELHGRRDPRRGSSALASSAS